MNDAFVSFRRDFPAFADCTYLNLAGRGLLSRTTRRALDAGFDQQMLGSVDKGAWKAAADDARAGFARIVHARPAEIACMKNVSDGLNALATALPWAPGDNAVVCTAFDHPNAAYAWLNLRRLGVELRETPLLADGSIDTARMLRAVDGRTRMVAVSSVNFLTGARAELGEIGTHCRRHGVFFLVDGAQSTGVLDLDVEAACVDGWCASANKGLLGPYGVGLLYCHEEWAATMHPCYLSRFGIDAGELPESEMGPQHYALYAGARRFEVGNANWAGLMAVAASMAQLLILGTATIEVRAVELATRLSQGLLEAGFNVPRPERHDLRSHIVAVHGGVHGEKGVAALDAALRAHRIVFSRRLGAIRFGLHAYNDEIDVDRVVDLARLVQRSPQGYFR
ncbi:MAG: aminotransferase class V-fold PLP-dependent enzyme [Burkholderiaceae bacterium]